MPMAAINIYLEHIPAVMAERRLVAADGASVPHLENPRKIVRIWEKLVYGSAEKKKAPPALLKLAGIGVKHAKK